MTWLPLACHFQVHPCSMCQSFITLNGWIIFQCVALSRFQSHLSVDGHLRCVHCLAVMHAAAVSIHAHVSVWTYYFWGSCSCFVFSEGFQGWDPLNSVWISGTVESRVPLKSERSALGNSIRGQMDWWEWGRSFQPVLPEECRVQHAVWPWAVWSPVITCRMPYCRGRVMLPLRTVTSPRH